MTVDDLDGFLNAIAVPDHRALFATATSSDSVSAGRVNLAFAAEGVARNWGGWLQDRFATSHQEWSSGRSADDGQP
jgi:hypothetical protein